MPAVLYVGTEEFHRWHQAQSKPIEMDPKGQEHVFKGGNVPEDCKQKIIGFMDGVLCAREEYARMWLTTDPSVYMERLVSVIDKAENLLHGLDKRETRYVRAGAAKKKVDDMLEYAVRLVSGARVLKDEKEAQGVLYKVVAGPFPQEKKSVAASMLCYIMKLAFCRPGGATLNNHLSVMALSDMNAAYGPVSHCSFTLAFFFEGLRDIEPYKSFQKLWTGYDAYRKENGLQVRGAENCVVCGCTPRQKRGMKRCAGTCILPQKPKYCGRACQRKDWPKHKRFCRKSSAEEPDSDDSEEFLRCFYDYDECSDLDSEDEAGDSAGLSTGVSKREPSRNNGDNIHGQEDRGQKLEETEDEREDNQSDTSEHDETDQDDTEEEKRRLWNDPGDDDFDDFVLEIALSVGRLRTMTVL